ncbi:uncharacterized protein TNCV_4007471 [Trichonephila clavipes]|nr:uncharacterized protein TNCV_4007471 [Trichonephila clavipes]
MSSGIREKSKRIAPTPRVRTGRDSTEPSRREDDSGLSPPIKSPSLHYTGSHADTTSSIDWSQPISIHRKGCHFNESSKRLLGIARLFWILSTKLPTITDAARGLLATDHVILDHGQVTWTTPELAPPLLTTTPHQREDVSAFDRFNVHRCPTRRVFSGTGFELVTRQATIRHLDHSATAALFQL